MNVILWMSCHVWSNYYSNLSHSGYQDFYSKFAYRSFHDNMQYCCHPSICFCIIITYTLVLYSWCNGWHNDSVNCYCYGLKMTLCEATLPSYCLITCMLIYCSFSIKLQFILPSHEYKDYNIVLSNLFHICLTGVHS